MSERQHALPLSRRYKSHDTLTSIPMYQKHYQAQPVPPLCQQYAAQCFGRQPGGVFPRGFGGGLRCVVCYEKAQVFPYPQCECPPPMSPPRPRFNDSLPSVAVVMSILLRYMPCTCRIRPSCWRGISCTSWQKTMPPSSCGQQC